MILSKYIKFTSQNQEEIMNTQDFIDQSKELVKEIIDHKKEKIDSRTVISRYTAAIAVNFTDWMGKTLLWASHEKSKYVLPDNLHYESKEDHVGMLLDFARQSNALPRSKE